MKTYYVSDLQKGLTLTGETFALKESKKFEAKNGKPYYRVTLADKTGSISGQIWADNIPNVQSGALTVGGVVMINAIVEEYKDVLQLNIQNVSKVDEVQLGDYIEGSQFNLDELWQKLESHIEKIQDKTLQSFIKGVFADETLRQKFKTRPAAENVHHAFQGGLLEHVVEMLEMSTPLREFYKRVNYDLVIVGAILHDIGKLEELNVVGTAIERTTEGYLVGHLIKSYEFLCENAKGKISDEHFLALKHIILSHHGLLEYGSPVVPATIEAAVVHSLDHASSNIRIYDKVLKNSESSDGQFSEYDRILGTKVYKGSASQTTEEQQILGLL